MDKYRPVKRLVREVIKGQGKAEVADKKRLRHILWMASRGGLGKRNVGIIWMLFGSALRVNEIAKLKVFDMIRESGELKTTFSIPASYTKTNKSRAVFMLAKPQIKAIEEWIAERLEFNVFVSDKDTYRGLNPDMPMFAITRKGKSWRTMAFRKEI